MRNSEQETILYKSEVAAKNHPQIMLRGEIDSLLARTVYTCAAARERGEQGITQDLTDVIRAIRCLMSSEASGEEKEIDTIIGLTLDEIREVSYHPKEYLHTGHYFPDENTDSMTALLNLLRTDIRRTERTCIAAGLGQYANRSIQKILNRLSSVVYIIMLKYNSK